MQIQIRLRGPAGQARVDIDDEKPLGELVRLIKETTQLIDFTLKYGYPLKNLDIGLDELEKPVKEFQLRGETIVVVPIEAPQATAIGQGAAKPNTPPKFTPKGIEPDETSLEWSERGGHIGMVSSLLHSGHVINMHCAQCSG